ncbi:MAG: MBOAT family protein [Planctomycetes bacterium]|nr:MBOAT family protein [Planctomycetota bacterium]MCP4770569.1 MBOAT family protein [Planctomycetota bacterium]MCP4860340.1 MBOAT family protein [Planctomycetota bacterium]
MEFDSFSFAVFFAIIFPTTALLQRHVRSRNLFLLVASYYFYACWDWRFLSLIWISTAVDFYCGLKLDVTEDEAKHNETPAPRVGDRKVLLLSLCTNLGILGFFKYFNFFIDSAVGALNAIGLTGQHHSLNIILPVGISFYTFQTLSYTIDVYRRRIPTERNLLNFATFVAFFPQLVAGPIERAARLLPQIREPRFLTYRNLSSGSFLIVWGLFEKIVIADNAGRVANGLFAADQPSGLDVVIGVYAFAIQIYGDFSGYTNIARGVARCLGFDLMRNFNLPYFAVNPSDFWRRWHISLSTWLRDYLYIPLGGNRKGRVRNYINLMITMVLGGLWHGAAMHFVVWGFFHGLLLSIHRFFEPLLKRFDMKLPRLPMGFGKVIRIGLFFQVTCLGWLIFRVRDLPQLGKLLAALTDSPLSRRVMDSESDLIGLALSFLILIVYETFQYRSRDPYILFKAPLPVRAFAYMALILSIVLFGEYGGESFLYFQF